MLYPCRLYHSSVWRCGLSISDTSQTLHMVVHGLGYVYNNMLCSDVGVGLRGICDSKGMWLKGEDNEGIDKGV